MWYERVNTDIAFCWFLLAWLDEFHAVVVCICSFISASLCPICSIPQKMFTFFVSPYTQLTWNIWFWGIQTLLSHGTKVKPQRIHRHSMWHAAEGRIGLVHFYCFSVMWGRLFPHSVTELGRHMWIGSLFPTENIKSHEARELIHSMNTKQSVIVGLV